MPLHDTTIRDRVPSLPPIDAVLVPNLPSLEHDQFDFDPEDDLLDSGAVAVYRAKIPNTDRTVALKQPSHRRSIDPGVQQRLIMEAEQAVELHDHEYIATVLDWGKHPYPWIAVEYLDGGDLTEYIGSMGIDQRLWTAFAIVDAITHANSRAAGHFDITPSNILFARTEPEYWNVPKLIDWGVSRRFTERRPQSEMTFPYASPEMLDSSVTEDLDVRSDVYQTGVVCYEVLTGTHPDHLEGTVRPPSDLADVPKSVDHPIMRAIEPDPNDRFDHTALLKEALQKILLERFSGSSSEADSTGGGTIRGGRRSVGQTAEARQIPGVSRRSMEPSDRQGPWQMHRGNPKRTGRTTTTGVLDCVSQMWAFETGKRVPSAPVVVDNTVFFGSDDENVYALRGDTGAERWRFETNGRVRSSSMVTDRRLFVGSRDGRIYALDVEDGSPEWTYETDFWVSSSPVVSDGLAYVGSNDFSVYALEAEGGELLWRFETEGQIGRSSPAVKGDLIVIGSEDGNVYGLDADTGAERWRFETDFSMLTTPAVDGGVAYVGGSQNRLYAIDVTDGSLQWTFQAGDSVQAAPAVTNERVIVGSDDGNVYAVDRVTGEDVWTFPTNDWVSAAPTVVDDTVYVGSESKNVYALATDTGRPRWRHNLGAAVTASPAIVDGTVYVGTTNGLHALASGRD